MLVTTERTGSAALVASSLPPRPTSSTASFTPSRAKWRRAKAVATSKKLAPRASAWGRTSSKRARSFSSGMGLPWTWTRSEKRTRWGLV
jgi:hypothetical protein